MIEQKEAEDALANLYKTQKYVRPITLQARLKAHMLKHIEGLLVKGQHNLGIPVTVATQYARAEDKYLEALQEEAEAAAELASLNESRDTDKIAISLYQSAVKDRM
jgi:undecaprenyl pyrophosphate synthase